MEANSTGGQGSRRAVAPSDDDERQFLNRISYMLPNWSIIMVDEFVR